MGSLGLSGPEERKRLLIEGSRDLCQGRKMTALPSKIVFKEMRAREVFCGDALGEWVPYAVVRHHLSFSYFAHAILKQTKHSPTKRHNKYLLRHERTTI